MPRGTAGPPSGSGAEPRRADRWLLPVFGRIVVITGLLVSAWDAFLLRSGTDIYGSLGLIGFALLCLGLGLYAAGRVSLGRLYSESVRVGSDHRLITRGVYRYIRHPMYLGVILFVLSAPLILRSLYGFIVMLLLVPMILRRIGIEEKAMTAQFGDEYAAYARKTKKLIPYVY